MPYVEPDKKAPETPSKVEQINDFSGGLNTTINGSLLNKSEAQKAINVSFEQKGTIVPLKGRVKRYPAPYHTSPTTGLGMLFKQDGTSHLVMASDDRLYSDAPRMSYRYTEKPDWEKGTTNQYASLGRTEGSVVVDAGTLGILTDGLALTGFSPFSSAAGTTYGWKFNLSRPMKAFKLRWVPLIAGTEYTLTLWEGWVDEGQTANRKVMAFKKTPLPNEINTLQTIELTDDMLNNVTLLAGKDYVLSIHCPLANGVARYLVSGTPVKPDYVTYAGSFSIAGDLYPTTVTTTTATFYGLTLMLEYLHHEETIKDKTRFDAGTYTDLEYDDLNVGVVTHASPTFQCNTLTKPLEGVLFNDFTIDSGVLNFLKTTTTNSNNKTGLLYPYCSNFRITAFPTSTTFASNTELTNAQYLTIKDTGTATSFATGTTANQFSGLKMTYYMPTEVFDREKLTKLSFTMSIAPIDATTKILVYALPAGGTELGVANTQVLVATYDPNVYRPYTLEITADPKRFVDPVTGAINLYITTDVVAKGITISAFKMNDTFVEKTVEELRAALSVGYSVAYGDGQSTSKTLSYMTGDNSIALYDKDRTTITIGAQSGAYSKAILPVLTVVTRSGLRLKRKALPVRAYVSSTASSGTRDNLDIVNTTDVALARQGVDTTASAVKTTGTHTQTVYDAGKDAVVLDVDPSQQSTAGLPGWSYGKKITIPANTVSETLTNFPLTVYLNQSNFDFSKAKPDGTDIRFTDMALNPLKFERVEHTLDPTLTLLAHMDEVVLDDASSNRSTFITNGVSALSTTQSKFGAKSLYLGPNGSDYVRCYGGMNGIDLSKDFTIDWWEYCITASATGSFLTTRATTTGTMTTHSSCVLIANNGTLLYTGSGQTWNGINGATIKDRPVGMWVHWALVKQGTTWRSFKNGTQFWSTTNSLVPGSTDPGNLTIGAWVNDATYSGGYNAYVDELRISNVARWSSAFTPDTQPYSNIGNLALAKYTVNVPSVSPAGTDILMFYGNPNAYNASCEAWQDMTGKGWTYNGNAKIRPNTLGVAPMVVDLSTGTFINHTKALISGADTINGSTGVSITGTSTQSSSLPPNYGGHLRVEKIIDTTSYNTLTFWARKGSDHGVCRVVVDCPIGASGTAIDACSLINVHYSTFPTTWTRYTVSIAHLAPGNHAFGFVGGYTDSTGNATSNTRYCSVVLSSDCGLVLDGSGDALYLPNSASDFNFMHQVGTTGKWAVEINLRGLVSFSSAQVLLDTARATTTNHGAYIGISTTRAVIVEIYRGVSGSYVLQFSSSAGVYPSDGLDHSLVVTYDHSLGANNAKIFIDGVLVAQGTKTANAPTMSSCLPPYISTYNGTTSSVNGIIRGIRITKGRARYTTNFTPPTSFEIDDTDVVFCSNFDTVYDQNYAMVQHMGAHLIDASGNGNNGTATGTTVVDTVYGKARQFNGTSDLINVTNNGGALTGDSTYTILAMIKRGGASGDRAIVGWGDGSTTKGSNGLSLTTTSNVVRNYWWANDATGAATIPDATDTVLAATYDKATRLLYTEGAQHFSLASTANNALNTRFRIGALPGATVAGYWLGVLGEIRTSSIARHPQWVKLESLALKNSVLTIADAVFDSYYATGTYESDVLDFSAVVDAEVGTETLVKTLNVPAGTSLTLSYKTSDDNVTWSPYAELTTPTLTFKKFMRFKADFTSDVDLAKTPEFKELTLGYKTGYHTEGYWTSDVIPLGMQGMLADTFAYVSTTMPAGTSRSFQTRHSSDGVTWTSWATTSPMALPMANYIQYRLKLMPDATKTLTPILKKAYISYAPDFEPSGTWESPVYDLSDYDPATIELLLHNAFADGAKVTPVTTITMWVKTSYNGTSWSDWQKLDIWNKDFKYSDISMNPFIRLKVDYASTSPKQTPYLEGLTFRENEDLKVAIWTSPAIDVSLAKSLDSGKLIASYLNGGGVLSLMTRSSPNGVDGWSPWTNVDASYTLTSPPNNFVQAKALFTGYQSKLDELVLSMDGNASVKLIGSGLSLGTDFSFTTLRDKLIIANGKDPLKKWNGVTETIEDIPDAPTLKYIISHHNRVWGVDAENQSRVRYSNILDPEKWDAFDFIDFNPEDGDYITAIMKYGQNLLISKQRSMALLTGNKTSNYAVSWLESEQGCSSHKAMCQADKYVAYVAQDGIRFSDLANSIVSTERVVPDWDKINKRRLSQAAVVYWRNKLFVALPTDESLVNNVVWVYDFLRNSWSMREGWSVSTWLKFNQYGEDILLAGSSVTGQLYQVDITEYDDNVPVTYTWRSKDFHFGAPQRYKLFRNIFLDISGTSDTTTLEVDLIVDGTVTGTYTTEIPAGAGDKHTRRILPPLYGAVLGSTISLEVRGRCGIQGITIEYVPRGAIPGGDL